MLYVLLNMLGMHKYHPKHVLTAVDSNLITLSTHPRHQTESFNDYCIRVIVHVGWYINMSKKISVVIILYI